MVFSSPTFLFLFLPVTLLVYHAIPVRSRGRNAWLLLASVLFYFWGAGSAILAILFVSLSSFGGAYIAMLIARHQRTDLPTGTPKKITIPGLGDFSFDCQILGIADSGQQIVTYCAAPGAPVRATFRKYLSALQTEGALPASSRAVRSAPTEGGEELLVSL